MVVFYYCFEESIEKIFTYEDIVKKQSDLYTMSSKTSERRKSGVFLGVGRVPQLIGPTDGDKGATYYEIHHKNVMSRFGKEHENPMNLKYKDDKVVMKLQNNSNWDYLATRWYRNFFCNACSCPVCGWLACKEVNLWCIGNRYS